MPNSTIKFYYRSYIDQDITGYTLSGNFIPLTNVNDHRHNTHAYTYIGLPAGIDEHDFDGVAVEIVADMGTNRDIDTIFLKSNFKTFIVYKNNIDDTGEDDWVEIANYTNNSLAFLMISFIEISTDKIKIVVTHTIAANESKKIYTLEITKYINELHIESIDQVQNYERENFKNLYGGSVQIVNYPNRGKVDLKLGWDNMDAIDYAIYLQLKSLGLVDACLIYLYLSEDYDLIGPEALYLVNDIEDIEATPSNTFATAGVKAKMHLLEC